MLYIGDVHGKIDSYLPKLGNGPSLQIGDMGLGFEGVRLPALPKRHRFLRGNHDSPGLCKVHKNYAGEFGFWQEHDLFFLSGAFSIDYRHRVPDVSWWEDEQLSTEQFQAALKLYLQSKPRIVASHECPAAVAHYLLSKVVPGFRPEKNVPDATKIALQAFFEFHKPAVWIFGHYHTDQHFVYEGTEFICLNELSSIEVK